MEELQQKTYKDSKHVLLEIFKYNKREKTHQHVPWVHPHSL